MHNVEELIDLSVLFQQFEDDQKNIYFYASMYPQHGIPPRVVDFNNEICFASQRGIVI